jgi:hypothetical protein
LLGWPKEPIVIRALGTPAGRVTGVRLLGHRDALQWSQEATGLKIALPAQPPCDHAVAFAISGVIKPIASADR